MCAPAIDPAHGTDDMDGRVDDDVVMSAQSSLTRSWGIGLAHMDPLIEPGAELTFLTRSLEWDIPGGQRRPDGANLRSG